MATFIALALVLLVSAPLAASADETSTDQVALEQRLGRVQYELTAAGKLGGIRREQLTKERSEIQGMITRLEAGQTIDPKEIDRLLGVREPAYVRQRP